MSTNQQSTHLPTLAPIQAIAEQVWSDRRVALGLAAGLTVVAGGAAPDPVDQLKRLAELHDAGVITAEEFESKKAEILSRM